MGREWGRGVVRESGESEWRSECGEIVESGGKRVSGE